MRQAGATFVPTADARVGVNVVVRAVSAALVAIPARSVVVFSRSLFIVDVVVVVE